MDSCFVMCLFRFAFLVFSCFCVFLLSAKCSLFIKHVREARKTFEQGWERLRCANQMVEQLSETNLDMVISICVNEGYSVPRCSLSVSW